ncbi:O-methyltransferase [Aspergillus nomiae NRRL 13137]|uniref:O-methyltransferase n=1 Tax=Aspergillus nomiae NRRL (strain ATCC 15546 / NRRL 13137 / CBS 260.88 / M93) TaxID=1509407 RepID=A0A0L1JI02_ASPN3|nr:O-methyltransferase [Aspergillus nomiae NRRL 13137]KNG91337.1 O-methyltransferase [Aspergillus nomiae NRRL 13137]
MAPVPSSSSSLLELANSISQSIPMLQDESSKHACNARANVIEACRRMLALVTSPAEMLKEMALIDRQNLASLQVINHYRIASIVPLSGSIAMSELAHKCGLPVDILRRILRQAMTYGAFSEPEPDCVAQTDVSREIPRLSPLLTYQLDVCLPSMVRLLDWLKDSDREHKCPYQIAHNTEDTWWTSASKRPELIENYGKYMALITSGGAHDVSYVLKGFAWEKLGKAIVVDVGGADGFVGIRLAEEYPTLAVIVEDNLKLKDSADGNIPRHLKSRVVFLPHSFFKPQSALGHEADVFLLRHILHDWNDNDCRAILQALAVSMKPGASIVVAEQILQSPGTASWQRERVMRALDMQMMIQFGSKERSYEDWDALFMSIDPPLEIVGCVHPAGSADSFMELKKRA